MDDRIAESMRREELRRIISAQTKELMQKAETAQGMIADEGYLALLDEMKSVAVDLCTINHVNEFTRDWILEKIECCRQIDFNGSESIMDDMHSIIRFLDKISE